MSERTTDELDRLRAVAQRRAERRMRWAGPGALALLGLITLASVAEGHPLLGRVTALAVLPVAALVLVAFAAAVVQRRRRGAWAAPQLAVAATPAATRRAVWRAVRRGRLSTSEPRRTLALELAQSTVRYWWAIPTYGVLAVLAAADAVVLQRDGLRSGFGSSALVFGGLFTQYALQWRGARRILTGSDARSGALHG
jgi:hypothetical protein